METIERLRQLLNERGWSEYKLAKKSGLAQSTIANIFKRNTSPSVITLKQICDGFGISLSQFFAENEMIEVTAEFKELFDIWVNLTVEQKKSLKFFFTLNEPKRLKIFFSATYFELIRQHSCDIIQPS